MQNNMLNLNISAIDYVAAFQSKAHLFAHIGCMAHKIYGLSANKVAAALEERESIGSTGFGDGVSIPHGKMKAETCPVSFFIRLNQPMEYKAHDGRPVDLIFALLSSPDAQENHLKHLAAVSRLMRRDSVQAKLRGAVGRDALFAILQNEQLSEAA